MAALNQAKIIKALEKLTAEATPQNFFFGFLKAFGFANSTIKKLETNDKSRNIALVNGDYGLAKQIYFRPVASGLSINSSLDELIDNPTLQKKYQVRFFITTDFKQIAAYDKRVDDRIEIDWEDLKTNFDFFLPLTGQYEKPVAYSSHPADVKACEKMGRLYDIIKVLNQYDDSNLHSLNVFLTRLLFCFFAEDTGIFPIKSQMTNALASMTAKDGHDLPEFFGQLFAILDLPEQSEDRRAYPATLQAFPYVNGGLFSEKLEIPVLNAKARNILLDCGRLTWSEISPVIFGSMFQSVMNPEERRDIGAHYTSEKNIFKVISPLFLDDLKDEFDRIIALKTASDRKKKLQAFQTKLANLKFLDPACGCGNFLIVAYREIKMLELEVAKELYATQPGSLSIDLSLDENISQVTIDQFYGIELLEFPVEVARVSMWLMEHVMNLKFGEQFGAVFPSIPLKKTPQIVCANALTIDWATVANPQELSYIFGNPPFVGASTMSKEQKNEAVAIFGKIKLSNSIDYVGAWYKKAVDLMQGTFIKAAFVSTNSITQGEQVAPLWGLMYAYPNFHVTFAHKTFKWTNEAKGNAGVSCVIIGFANYFSNSKSKKLYDENSSCIEATNINAYLIDGPNVLIESRGKPLCNVLKMTRGNTPIDDGNFIFSEEEKTAFLENYPQLSHLFKRYVAAKDFLNNNQVRYCLWLNAINPEEYADNPEIIRRLKAISDFRSRSTAEPTRASAKYPEKFFSIPQTDKPYLIIPGVSSENRKYVPIGFMTPDVIASNLVSIIPDASLYDFGILESHMHMTWMRTVCGRLESRYRYSGQVVYNTFPWPDVTPEQKKIIENLSTNILMTREFYPDMTLAELYDPDKMPEDLRTAHQELDMAVDKLYRRKAFHNDEQRLKHLFGRYEKLVKGEDSSTLFHEE